MRDRPETLAGRWAAKEAVSKVLGLGVRGIGWREIEIERLPTGQPAVRLHGRAAARAEQLGMGRIAVSISHESDYAVAIAFGVRTAGGRYLFPPDIEARLDDRERRVLRPDRAAAGADREAGRDDAVTAESGRRRGAQRRDRRRPSCPIGPSARPQGHVRASCSWSPARSTTPARPSSCARPPGRAGRRPGHPGRARVAPAAVRGQGHRGDHAGACPRTMSRKSSRTTPWPGSSTTTTMRSSSVRVSGPAWPRSS